MVDRVPGDERTQDSQLIYSRPEEALGIPRIVDGETWPGALRKWIYNRKIRPVALVGLLEDVQTFRENWLTGLRSFWDAASSFTWSTVLEAANKFFTNRNAQDASLKEVKSLVDTTSQASKTLTCAAGHAYRVIHAGVRNDTRAPDLITTLTPSGLSGVETIRPSGTAAVTDSYVGHVLPEVWMQASDTLAIEDGSFVAADVMTHNFIYEDYTLG